MVGTTGKRAAAFLRQCLLFLILGAIGIGLSARAAAEERGYPVGVGDQLGIFVYGSDNISNALSGRFRVDASGSIYYPLLGKVEVAGKTPAEIAKLLGDALSGQVPISLPTVSIAAFAPVFLTGAVASTGPFEFQPGMTVFQLVLQAGGLPQADTSESVRLSLMQDVSTLRLNAFALEVQRARLEAEIRGTKFEPDALPEPPFDTGEIVASEAAIYEAHMRIKDTRRKIYAAQKEGYEQEISTIEKSIALHDEEVRLLEEQVQVQSDLTKKGFAAQSGLRELERELASTRRVALEFRTALFRAKQNRLAVDQALAEAESRTEAENVEKLREVNLAIRQNDIVLAAANAKLARFDSARGTAQSALGRVPKYLLIRLTNGEATSRIVDASTKLQRGDIVRVIIDDEFDIDNAAAPVSMLAPVSQPGE